MVAERVRAVSRLLPEHNTSQMQTKKDEATIGLAPPSDGRHQRAAEHPCASCSYCDRVHRKTPTGWELTDEGFCTTQYSVVNGQSWYQEIPGIDEPRKCADYWQPLPAGELSLHFRGRYFNGVCSVPFEAEAVFKRAGTALGMPWHVARVQANPIGGTDWRAVVPRLQKWLGLGAGNDAAPGNSADMVKQMLDANGWEYKWQKHGEPFSWL